ncbi:hypothetical protein B0T11DRAFT_320410 [Plectosphaerella cucumerina]|uniref:Uncharacterized protein n=1 Tax=Plectosphaerella cucumerina TaxID=40658 RepID=A0A8K0WZE4_9PEZI|nr:hypothetical protein B0T11DRAFT_320410 [Plectosphaerella cucumerina]
MATVGMLVVILWFYSEVVVIMTDTTKREFNAWVTGLSIALGLLVAWGLSNMVGTLRWWILSHKHHSLRKHWPSNIAGLQDSKHSHTSIRVILGPPRRVALAIVGLCYSVEVATSQTLRITPGKVATPDLRTIQALETMPGSTPSTSTKEYIMNSYGLTALAYAGAEMDRLPVQGQLRDSSDPVIFCDWATCQYVFYERPATETQDDATIRLTVATDRSINATTTCKSWSVSATDLLTQTVSFSDKSGGGGVTSNISFPVVPGTDQTIYVTNTTAPCGIGCSQITALEMSSGSSWLYNCTVIIGTVSNATLPEHEVGDEVRQLAAGGIALQGYFAQLRLGDGLQSQVYPAKSINGYPNIGLAEAMARKITQFSIGAIAVMADLNTPVALDGFVPEQAVELVVEHWGYVSLILTGVALLHLALSVVMLWVSLRVVIPRGGPVALARVLASMTDKPESEPTSGHERGGYERWIYKFKYIPELKLYDVYFEREEKVPDAL